MAVIPRLGGHSNVCRWALGNGNPVANHIWLPRRTKGLPGLNHVRITFEKQNLITGLVLTTVLHPDFSPGEPREGWGEGNKAVL